MDGLEGDLESRTLRIGAQIRGQVDRAKHMFYSIQSARTIAVSAVIVAMTARSTTTTAASAAESSRACQTC